MKGGESEGQHSRLPIMELRVVSEPDSQIGSVVSSKGVWWGDMGSRPD